MNDKEKLIYDVLDIVIEECSMSINEATCVNPEIVRSKSKKSENIIMTRCVFITMLFFLGYSKTTMAAIMNRSVQAIRDILNVAHGYRKTSWVYREAETKCTLRIKEFCGFQ